MAAILDEAGNVIADEAGNVIADETISSFPANPLDLRCDLSVSGWTDVTSYLYQREGVQAPVVITRGRQDESSQVNAASCTFEVNNRSGNFSPKNPAGAWYGQLGRNTPVRFSLPAKTNYLRLEAGQQDRAYVNSNSNLDITGSIEMRISLRLSDWRATVLAAKWDGGGCWWWLLNSDGTMDFDWWDAGGAYHAATSTAAVPQQGNSDFALRVTMNTSTGNIAFWRAAQIGGPWTQLGAVVNPSGATSIATAGSPLVVGYSFNYTGQLCGRVYEYQLYDGIEGTIVADGAFTGQASGATAWTDSAGNLWQLAGGAEISSRDYRFHGETSSLPGKWDVTGTDVSVPVTSGGLMRRIAQGEAPEQSPMRRAVMSLTGDLTPVAYWPCEDAEGATAIGAAIGGLLMNVTGGTGDGSVTTTGPAFANDNTFTCSNSLPTLNGSSWYGPVGGYTSQGSIVVRFLMHLGTIPSGGPWAVVRLLTTGTCQQVALFAPSTSELRMAGYSVSGATVFDSGTTVMTNMPDPVWVSVELRPSGSSVDWSCVTLVPGASTGIAFSGSYTGTVGNILQVRVSPAGLYTDTVIGHITVQSAWQSMFDLYQPLNAWTGETAAARFARLAGEDGYQARIIGSPGVSAPMGGQPVDTLANLLQSCEDADRGQIFEPRTCLGLGYRTLASLCCQPAAVTVDYSQAQPGGVSGDGSDSGLDPTYDDQLTRNDWTLTRSSGQVSGATFQYQLNDGSPMSISNPPAGIGDYSDTLEVNVQADSQLPDLASWMVHVGSVDEARWPSMPLNLARAEISSSSSLYYQLAWADIGDYITVVNLPAIQVPDPPRQLIWQVTESLGGFHHTLEWNLVPESPYETGIYDDPVYGRADTDGSSLVAAAGSSAASLSVATDPGYPLWTTADADFPFDIQVSGERMTVTAITGASSPQTFTVTRSVNGVVKSQAAGAGVRLWFPPVYALT